MPLEQEQLNSYIEGYKKDKAFRTTVVRSAAALEFVRYILVDLLDSIDREIAGHGSNAEMVRAFVRHSFRIWKAAGEFDPQHGRQIVDRVFQARLGQAKRRQRGVWTRRVRSRKVIPRNIRRGPAV